MFLRPLILPILTVALTLPLHAAEKAATFIEPENAGPDFAVQGEYVGEGSAAQVIALGDGKFRIVGWAKSLPGIDPEAERKVEVNAEAEPKADGGAQSGAGRVVFDNNGWKGAIVGAELQGTDGEGNTWKLKKTERKSPTAGAKPPAGAIVLFDGTNADAWQGGKVDSRGLLQCGTKSKQSFGDCTLHIEFRTPFMPAARGQARGNSGVYMQDRHEVQVLDSFGLKGENNECGGIYTVAKPRVNMCFPPLSWQTYDIDFESARYDAAGAKTANARITVRHNGVLIHDRVEVPKATGSAGRKEGADAGPIQLQNHGNPVFYRNIWVVEKEAE